MLNLLIVIVQIEILAVEDVLLVQDPVSRALSQKWVI